MVLYILLTSLKTRISTVYKTKKKDEEKAAIAATNNILRVTPSTEAKNEEVITEIRSARMMAIKRGLRDIVKKAFGH